MPRGTLRFWTLVMPAILWLPLTGCSSHDRAWDPGGDAEPGPRANAATPPPLPSRDIVITVSANGAITCKQDDIFVVPLTSEQLARNEGSDKSVHVVIVQDNAHDRERCFPVGIDLDSTDVSCRGSVTLRHVRPNLIVEVDGPSSVTIFSREGQEEVDECGQFAADNDVDRLAGRLNSDPSLVDGRESKSGRTALATAADAGRAETVEFLLDRKANTDVKDNQGFTPLHLAVRRGRLDIVRILVRHGADVNAVTAAGNTPMHLALRHNNTEIAAFLAGAGANGNVPNQSGKTPMQMALDKVFELSGRRAYGPFADGSSIRYSDSSLYVLRSGHADANRWEQFDLPSSRETWISLEGTNFLVMVRGRGTYRVWARYHTGPPSPAP